MYFGFFNHTSYILIIWSNIKSKSNLDHLHTPFPGLGRFPVANPVLKSPWIDPPTLKVHSP